MYFNTFRFLADFFLVSPSLVTLLHCLFIVDLITDFPARDIHDLSTAFPAVSPFSQP